MSGFRQRRQETELERRLREERPEAPEQLVRMVAERSAKSDRRRLVPRLALVGAVTAVMLAALGATGTASYASVAISSFGSTIGDVIYSTSTPKPSATSQTSASTSQTSGSPQQKAAGNPANASPFQDQYHQKWPVCHNGITLYLPLPGYNAHLLHGDQPGVCS
jgi:hypothetical protein